MRLPFPIIITYHLPNTCSFKHYTYIYLTICINNTDGERDVYVQYTLIIVVYRSDGTDGEITQNIQTNDCTYE
jgi:hypothetical protein